MSVGAMLSVGFGPRGAPTQIVLRSSHFYKDSRILKAFFFFFSPEDALCETSPFNPVQQMFC